MQVEKIAERKTKLYPSSKRKKRTKNKGLLAWEANKARATAVSPFGAVGSYILGPSISSRSGQDESRTSQDSWRKAGNELSVQPEIDLNPQPILCGPSSDTLPVDPYLPVFKTEPEEYEIDGGPIVKLEVENDGYVSTNLELSSHCDSLPHFGERSCGSAEESLHENNDDPSEVERLCRLCLEELKDFTYIFEFDDIHGFNVGDAINDLLGMDLNPDDGYPTKICNDCLEEVNHFRRFKGRCFQSRAKLREIIGDKSHFESDLHLGDEVSEEDNANDIPNPSEIADENPGRENNSMPKTRVECEIPEDSIKKEMEDIDLGSEGIDIVLHSVASDLQGSVVDSVQEDTSHNSQLVGRVTVKRQYLMLSQAASTSEEGDMSPVSATVSDVRLQSNLGTSENLTASASSLEPPAAKKSFFPPVKEEIVSEDEDLSDKQDYLAKGEKNIDTS